LIALVYKGINSLSDLRGKRIGVIINTSAQFFLHAVLEEGRVKLSEVTEEAVDLSAPGAMLKAGKLDAVALYEPYASLAKEEFTTHKLFIKTGDMKTSTVVSYIMKKSYVDSHPEVVSRLLLATGKSIEWIKRNRTESIQISSKLMNLPVPIMDSIWNDYDFHLGLDNDYVNSLSAQGQWTAAVVLRGKANVNNVPNYRDFLDAKPLERTYPKLVTFTR